MNAVELLFPDHKPPNVWMCQQCRHLYGGKNVDNGQERAESCCTPKHCKTCNAELPQASRYSTFCHDCHLADVLKREEERLAKAEKLETWDGWVHAEGHGDNDGFFRSLEEYVEWLAENLEPEDDWPEWVYVCKVKPFKGISAQSICEGLTENLYEDAMDDLQGVEELEAACKAFNEANKGMVTYLPCGAKVVRVPARKGE